jgi:hypothetical protein
MGDCCIDIANKNYQLRKTVFPAKTAVVSQQRFDLAEILRIRNHLKKR